MFFSDVYNEIFGFGYKLFTLMASKYKMYVENNTPIYK